ncbi:MAG: FIST C-terminal domain-containing protein [Bacteroidetes bacterium]|nr:FIST C-terminal domain-containing protein [Bacteroidota bacterium]MBS1686662.1 FIST C-terminal domain-containing protein [Bacteroidota bacterium]
MQIKQYRSTDAIRAPFPEADLVLVFAGREALAAMDYTALSGAFPQGIIVSVSTAGEILQDSVYDAGLAITAIDFHKTTLQTAQVAITDYPDSITAGRVLIGQLPPAGLRHVLVFADGSLVNGSDLTKGMNLALPAGVTLSGGLAGDGARFEQTLVGLNGPAQHGQIVAVGLYGDSLSIGYGSVGGWSSFGPERRVTRSQANVLYELDGKSALGLYKQYLGDLADQLPGSALLFPLSITVEEHGQPLVRTILSIDEGKQSMTFAGNIPEGSYARLMRGNFDSLIEAAGEAAGSSLPGVPQPELALLVSCVGRKIVLDQRIDEEIERVREVLGPEAVLTGFYSYGEISPLSMTPGCDLHNQTMTITTMREI